MTTEESGWSEADKKLIFMIFRPGSCFAKGDEFYGWNEWGQVRKANDPPEADRKTSDLPKNVSLCSL